VDSLLLSKKEKISLENSIQQMHSLLFPKNEKTNTLIAIPQTSAYKCIVERRERGKSKKSVLQGNIKSNDKR